MPPTTTPYIQFNQHYPGVSRDLWRVNTGHHVAAAPAPSAPGACTRVATYMPFPHTDIHARQLPPAQRTCPAGAPAPRTTRIHIGTRQRATHHRAALYPLPARSQLIFPLWARHNAVPSSCALDAAPAPLCACLFLPARLNCLPCCHRYLRFGRVPASSARGCCMMAFAFAVHRRPTPPRADR